MSADAVTEEPTKTKKIPFPRSEATLTCGHVVTYKGSAPSVSDYVYCYGCDDYQTVTHVTRKGVVKM